MLAAYRSRFEEAVGLRDKMINRTISHILRTYVLPELHPRLTAGSIKKDQLPPRLYQFRLVSSGGQNKVELNNEVQIHVEVKTTRDLQAGETITLADIHPEETILKHPIINGQPAADFLCQSVPIGFLTIFDFLPDSAGIAPEDLAAA